MFGCLIGLKAGAFAEKIVEKLDRLSSKSTVKYAVTKKGEVLQVGTPQELYMNPKSIFVAYFIGGANFFESFIAEATDKTATIEFRGGLKVQAVNKGLNRGEKVVLAIRPEVFTIKRSEGRGTNSIFGVVERVAFVGTNLRYEVRLENQDLVVVVTPSLSHEWFNVGEKITVSFQPENAHLFAYPEAGIREELAVE